MLLRAVASLTAQTGLVAGLLAGLLALVGSAAAQNYPPPPPGFPAPYRTAPPPVYDPDDDDQYVPAPPGPYGRSSANAPYPYDPQQSRRYGTPIERQALPGPGAGVPEPYGGYEDGPGARPYGGPPEPGYRPMRPPADISASQQGPILDLNRGPGAGTGAGAAPGGYPPPPPGFPQPAYPQGVPMQQATPSPVPPRTVGPNAGQSYASLPPDYQPETGERKDLPENLRRQMVDLQTREPAGTIIIDTPNTYMYLVLGGGKAMRYGIGVGREGFTWNGTERISRMAEWPDWHPPSEMIERQPYLPRFMAGGESNPLGARALYLGKTLYRIHGTNQPSTIGTFVSSGCIRLTNDDISDLYSRVQVGTRVVVLPGGSATNASAVR
jgi:lipoprotein-anchoring transpeptidase ErfK/SrfK